MSRGPYLKIDLVKRYDTAISPCIAVVNDTLTANGITRQILMRTEPGYKKILDHDLEGTYRVRIEAIEPGDVIIMKFRDRYHLGCYIGDGKFIHARDGRACVAIISEYLKHIEEVRRWHKQSHT